MDKHEQAVARAEEAQRLMASPMFTQAFDDTRTALLEAWAALPDVNSEQARDIHRRLKCLESVKRCIETHISTGKLAQKEIEGRRRLFEFRRA